MRVVGSRPRAGLFLFGSGSIGIADAGQPLLRVWYLRLLCEEDLPMTTRRLKGQGFKLALWGCLALLLIASACTPPPPPDTRAADEAAIRDADAQWAKTAGANDLEGTVAYYTEDASMLAPNAPIANGKQAIHAAWAGLLGPGTSISWQATKVEVARSSDLATIM